jgi:hypothetical protein
MFPAFTPAVRRVPAEAGDISRRISHRFRERSPKRAADAPRQPAFIDCH